MIKVVVSEHYSSNIPALHKILDMSPQVANAKLYAPKQKQKLKVGAF